MRRERLWSVTFVALLVFIFFNQIVGAGLNTGTSVYLESTGKGAGLAGIGALVFSISSGIFRIVIGPIIDKRGRIAVMMAGAAFYLVGSLGPLVANEETFFVLWRVIQGFGMAAGTTSAFTAAADVVPVSRLGESVGYAATSQAIAMSIGPMLAIMLASSSEPASMYVGLAICALCMVLVALLCRYEKNPGKLPASATYRRRWESGEVGKEEGGKDEPIEPDSLKHSDASKESSKCLLGDLFEMKAFRGALPNMLIAAAYAFSVFYAGVFGATIGVENPGMYYLLSAVAMLVVRFLSSRWFDTVAPVKLMAVACAAGMVGFALALATMGAEMPARNVLFYGAGVCYGVCTGIVTPLCQSVAIKESPADRWGGATAFFYFTFDFTIGVVSALYGVAIDSLGYAPVIVCTMVFVALSFVSAAIGFPREEGAAKR